MRKLILKCEYAPGDIIMLTAAVRDLHRCYPGRFLTDVRTSCPDLWVNNPYITPLEEKDPAVEEIKCTYPLINRCNQTPYHCLHGFIEFLNRKLGLAIQPTAFKGDLHLSAQEKAWYSQVRELTGEATPFWIIGAGGKYDITIKWWSTSRYQAVVDHFRGKIQFVQVGQVGHYHPRLEGVIDLRGRTNLRELVRLMYHSQGVVCGVTSLMHLAAAVPYRGSRSAVRPCVVIAGGREPPHWEAYPGHQFIHTIGALACCESTGCWKDRTFALRDGDKRDRTGCRCVDVVGNLPRCMDMISPAEVIRRVEFYFSGNKLKYLSSRQRKGAELGVQAAASRLYDAQRLNLHSAGMACEEFIRRIPPYPNKFTGRGIVICGGGGTYFPCAWVCVNRLRQLGCQLPIQVWHLGKSEMNSQMEAIMHPLQVECVDASKLRRRFPVRRLKGWELKAYALLHAPFRQVLLLDADNVPTVDPTFLFETPRFKSAGAIFWPDYASASGGRARPIWRSCGMSPPREKEFESGQILVDKARCWRALSLSMWFNEHSDFYYRYLHGDKETFHLAFRKLNQVYALVRTPVKPLPGTLCQHDFRGRRIFQHRNNLKWNLFHNKRVEGFLFETECLQALEGLKRLWNGAIRAGSVREVLDLARPRLRTQDAKIEPVILSCPERRRTCQQALSRFESTDWTKPRIRIQLDCDGGLDYSRRHTNCAYEALRNSLESDADYLLLLADDLDFNRHLDHNLRAWRPLQSGSVTVASLYNPAVEEFGCNSHQQVRLVAANRVYGSQAFIISKRLVQYLVKNWDRVSGPLDKKISRLAGRLGRPIFYHAPSLVRRAGRTTPWSRGNHQAVDFDPLWRA